jgi:4-hydroxy-tetrahydrodipicolinate synthase
VPQWIEALDRGIDAMIPESAMIGIYADILTQYRSGRRGAALELFRQLLPVLAYTNQEIAVSIAFFKRLLVRRGVFSSERMRIPGFVWDDYNTRIAAELIALYLDLEQPVE